MFYLATWQNSVLHWHQSHISMEIQYALEEQPEIINWCLISLRMVGAAWVHLSIWLKLAIMKMLRLMAMLDFNMYSVREKKSNHNNFVKKMSDVSVLVLMSPYSTPLLVFLHQDIPKHCHWHKAKCKVTHGSDLKIPKKTAPWVSSPPMSSMSIWMVYPQVSQKRPFFQSGSPKSFEPSWISKDLPKNFAKQPTWKQLFEYQCSLGQKMTVGRFMFVGLNP